MISQEGIVAPSPYRRGSKSMLCWVDSLEGKKGYWDWSIGENYTKTV